MWHRWIFKSSRYFQPCRDQYQILFTGSWDILGHVSSEFSQEVGFSPVSLVVTKPSVFKETSGNFQQHLWQTIPFILYKKMAHLKKRDLLQPCLWWPQEVFLGGIHPNHPNQVYFVPRHKPESKHCIAYSLNLSVVLQKRTLQTHILAIELVVCKNLILNIVWGSFETTLRCLKPMQHKRNSVHVCAYYMYAFSSCMWIFARDNKLLICWRDELNYPPPSAEMCSILHSVPDLWNWDDFFFFLFAMSWQL